MAFCFAFPCLLPARHARKLLRLSNLDPTGNISSVSSTMRWSACARFPINLKFLLPSRLCARYPIFYRSKTLRTQSLHTRQQAETEILGKAPLTLFAPIETSSYLGFRNLKTDTPKPTLDPKPYSFDQTGRPFNSE